MPVGEAKGSITPIRLSAGEKASFEDLAKKEGLSLSQWVRKTLNDSAKQ